MAAVNGEGHLFNASCDSGRNHYGRARLPGRQTGSRDVDESEVIPGKEHLAPVPKRLGDPRLRGRPKETAKSHCPRVCRRFGHQPECTQHEIQSMFQIHSLITYSAFLGHCFVLFSTSMTGVTSGLRRRLPKPRGGARRPPWLGIRGSDERRSRACRAAPHPLDSKLLRVAA